MICCMASMDEADKNAAPVGDCGDAYLRGRKEERAYRINAEIEYNKLIIKSLQERNESLKAML